MTILRFKRTGESKSTASEHKLQSQIVSLISRIAPDLMFYAVPNGGRRSLTVAVKLKAEGVRAGIPDLAFILRDGRAAFAEVKTPTGSLSKAQRDFRDWAIAHGVPWACVRSPEEMIAVLKLWGEVQ
jgi:hypothetical protein